MNDLNKDALNVKKISLKSKEESDKILGSEKKVVRYE